MSIEPKLTERLIVLVEPSMMDWLKEQAAHERCSVGELVRRAVASAQQDKDGKRVDV